ncbi:MAG: tetratricopeptide repeat protein [Niabella sp.]
MNKRLTILMICMGCAVAVMSQSVEDYIKNGNAYYKKDIMPAALQQYEQALQTRYHDVALMNKGNVLYKQGKYKEALAVYEEAASTARFDRLLRAGAYYNAGVVYSRQQKIAESIDAYKNALRLDPNDKQARENLQKALLARRQKEQEDDEPQQMPQSNLSKSKAQQELNKLDEKEKRTRQKLYKQQRQYNGSVGNDW